jgi:glycerate kinase
MKRFVLAPDSFKGTLSSGQICEIMKEAIFKHFPKAEVISIPVADGGEGSVDCFLTAAEGVRASCKAQNPLFEEMEGFYGLLDGGQTAVIEMAACAGLPLVEGRKNPLLTTTYGVGLLMRDAVARGVKKIILGLGGSATNDFGCGAAAALGISFLDESGAAFIPTGGTLSKVARVVRSGEIDCLDGVEISLMCDVKNPVYGPHGAAYIYAPQKGADPEQVRLLDDGLRHICEVVRRDLGCDVSTLVGGGAAGAMAGGMVAFFDAAIRMGIDVVLDTVGFERLLDGADLVFTGEGKIDAQSLQGKVVYGVASRAKTKNVPVIAVVGGIDGDMSAIYEAGVNAVFAINCLPEDFSVSRYKSAENLKTTMDNILRTLKI